MSPKKQQQESVHTNPKNIIPRDKTPQFSFYYYFFKEKYRLLI